MNHRLSGLNTLNRKLVPACPFTESLTATSVEEMCVVEGSPSVKTTLPATPTDRPVEGFDETDGEMKKNGNSLADAVDSGSAEGNTL